MNNIEVQAKIDLKTKYYDNELYCFSSEEKDSYNSIIRDLNGNYGFLDIVLDFSDYYQLEPLFDTISKMPNFDVIKNTISMQYLLYSILNKANIVKLDNSNIGINDIQYNLFSNNLKNIFSGSLLNYIDVYQTIRRKAKEETEKGYARIICLLDNVHDIHLQQCINDLVVYRGDVSIIGFTTKELASSLTTNKKAVDDNKDYKLFMSEKKMSELKKEGMRR